MELVIRKAERHDAIAVWEIRNAAILAACTGHYPDEQLAAWTGGEITDDFIETVAEHWYVATVNGTVVGTGMLDRAIGQVDAIFVRPDRMGCGVGRAMMAHYESPRGISLACIPMAKQLVASAIAGEQSDARATSAQSILKSKSTSRSP